MERPLRRNVYYGMGPKLASAWRKRWHRLMHPRATVRFGPGCHVGPGFSLYITPGSTFTVGANSELRTGFRAEVVGGGRVEIGDDCVLSYHSLIQCTSSVKIGDRCGLGQALAIFDGKHHYDDPTRPFVEQGFDLRPVTIGDDVMVLSKVTIVADVGDHAVVGANSFVNRPVPAYTVVGGVPAKPLSYFGPPGGEPPALVAQQAAPRPG